MPTSTDVTGRGGFVGPPVREGGRDKPRITRPPVVQPPVMEPARKPPTVKPPTDMPPRRKPGLSVRGRMVR